MRSGRKVDCIAWWASSKSDVRATLKRASGSAAMLSLRVPAEALPTWPSLARPSMRPTVPRPTSGHWLPAGSQGLEDVVQLVEAGGRHHDRRRAAAPQVGDPAAQAD